MFKSDEEVNRILNHPMNVAIKGIGRPDPHKTGLRPGDTRRDPLTKDEKVQVGTIARILGSKATGELLDLDRGHVTRIREGLDCNYKAEIGSDVKEKIEDNLAPIRTKALASVDFLIDVMNSKADKLPASKAASAAKNMVDIYDKLGPKNGGIGIHATQVVFYAPRVLKSQDYLVQEVEAS